MPFDPAAAWLSSCLTSPSRARVVFADGAQERVKKESASMCVVGVLFEAIETTTTADKMLLKEVLNNTGWTSADAEQIFLG